MLIQGYALPWESPAYVERIVETVAPRAVSIKAPCALHALTHDGSGRVFARTGDQSMWLWHDGFGLAFSARVDDPEAADWLGAVIRGGTDQCSVNFTHMDRRPDGRVIWGQIDHITITASPAYANTGCWLADMPLRNRPSHNRQLSALWAEGLRQRIKDTGPQAARVGSGQAARGRGVLGAAPRRPTAPASVVALMADSKWKTFGAAQHRALKDMEADRR